jgi:hypothetical protein
MSPLPLTTADLENLNSSFIDPNLAKKAGLYRVSSIEGARLMSRNGGRDYSGVIYPYLLPENSTVRMLRLRRDRPDVERKSDGSYKQTGKYLTRKGQGNLIYFAPDTKSAWLTDISLPVAITEGEKKTLSLHRLSWHGGEGNSPCPNFLPLGLSGIWNWRGKFGEEKDAQGRTRVLKGPIPDLELLTWQDRTVFIVFDSNAITNTNVYRARRALTDELIARGHPRGAFHRSQPRSPNRQNRASCTTSAHGRFCHLGYCR